MAIFPAITLHQPWASLVAEGAKPFEFRRWPAAKTLWGKRIAIHAGKRPARRDELQDLLLKLTGRSARETGLKVDLARRVLERVLLAPKSMPLGCVVCTAIVGEPVRDAALRARLGLPEQASEVERDSNWGWPLSEVRAVMPPAPAVGRQGWWSWSET